MKIKIVCVLAMLACASVVFAGGSKETTSSGNFFDETVRLVIPYGAGGTHDVMTRKFAEVAAKYVKKPPVCENITGGDGVVAATQFTRESPNTRDLLVTSYGLWYQKIMRGDAIPLDLSKLDPVGTFDDRSYLLYVRADSPFNTIDSFLAETRKREVTISAGAVGADAHLCAGSLIKAAGGSSRVVSYEGGAEQINALVNGEVDCFVGTPQVGQQYLRLGKLVALVCFKDFDFTGFKDSLGIVVPNVASLGYPESAITGGGFFSVHAGADPQIHKDVEEVMRKVWADPDFKNFTLENGLNIFECYSADLTKQISTAEANARNAARNLGLIK